MPLQFADVVCSVTLKLQTGLFEIILIHWMLFSVYHYRACTHITLHAEVHLVVSLHSLSRSQSLNLTKGLATSFARTHTHTGHHQTLFCAQTPTLLD